MAPKVDIEALVAGGKELRREGIRGRYAPSPTGSLHLGNLRTALYAWLQVRLQGGVLVLRMEDLDLPRVQEGSAEEILADLRWLGLDWDEGPGVGGPAAPYVQSERSAIYEAVLSWLDQRDLVFRCYCSRKDVREASSAPHGPGGIAYPGTCRFLSPEEEERVRKQKRGRKPSYRFRVASREVVVEDRIAGSYREELSRDVGDFIIRRRDDLFAYQLAVVVDDAMMGITDVVRGEDLLSSAPRQVALFEALQVEPPHFWHVPLMRDEGGERLSKRDGSDSLKYYREKGWDGPKMIGFLASSLGWIEQGARLSAGELSEEIGLEELLRPAKESGPP